MFKGTEDWFGFLKNLDAVRTAISPYMKSFWKLRRQIFVEKEEPRQD